MLRVITAFLRAVFARKGRAPRPAIMSGQPLLASDNGFVFRRNGANDFSLVWTGTHGTHGPADEIVAFNGPAFSTPSRVPTMTAATSSDAGNPEYPLYSSDAGGTWAATSAPRLSGFGQPHGGAKDGTYNWIVQENGTVWSFAQQTASPNHHYLFSMVSPYTTWVQVFDLNATFGVNPNLGLWIGNNWLWYLDGPNKTLRRCDLTGGNVASWVITPPGGISMSSFGLNGWPGTNRLVSWSWATTRAVLSIDISDVDNPVFTWTAAVPFGTSQIVWDIFPLTNSILIANVVDDTVGAGRDLSGSIWRSTDGGSSWSSVHPNTSRLGVAATQAGAGFDNEISAVAPDPTDNSHVWVAMCPPYVYHSEDQGATWGFETVDLSVCDPFGGVRPQEWCGICVAGAAAAAARTYGFVTQMF